MRKRKIFPLLLALCLLLICLPADAFAQNSFSWTLEGDVLTISGTYMPNWDGDSPWYTSREQIKKVVIQDGMTNIGAFAFSQCINLTDVTIPGSVTGIYDGAFYNCTSLQHITIPEGVRILGEYAFAGCSSLVNVSIPKSLDFVEPLTVFHHCFSLTEIRVAQGNPTYASVDGLLCSADQATLVCVPAGRKGALVLPESVTTLERGAFHECAGITGITFPKNLTGMGSADFSGCTGLETALFQGDRPDFTNVVFPVQTVVYYPAGNATWQAGTQDNGHIGGQQPWQSYDLSEPPTLGPTEPRPTEPQPTELIPTEPKPTEPIPTEPKPTEPQPTETKPTEPQPTENKPTDPKPTEQTDTKPTKLEATDPKPTEPAATDGTRPAAPTPAKTNGRRIIGLVALLVALCGAGGFCGIVLYQEKKQN